MREFRPGFETFERGFRSLSFNEGLMRALTTHCETSFNSLTAKISPLLSLSLLDKSVKKGRLSLKNRVTAAAVRSKWRIGTYHGAALVGHHLDARFEARNDAAVDEGRRALAPLEAVGAELGAHRLLGPELAP